jgi:hypothetical protein
MAVICAEARVLKEHNSGASLLAAANRVADALTDEPVDLLATSVHGVALAAAVCVLRGEHSVTRWHHVRLLTAACATEYRQFFVELTDPGAGWRLAATRRYPTAQFLFAEELLRRHAATAA